MTQPYEPNIPPPAAGSPPPADGSGPPGPGYAYQQPPPADPYATPLPPPAGGYAYGQPGTAVVPTGMYADPVSGLTLPQGTELASVGRRIGAYFLAIPLAIVTLGIGYLIWGLIVWGKGQTPALQVLGMRCWRPEEGRVAGFWWMALREIVGRLAESIFWLITSLVSFILFLTRPDRRTLHDLIAGTVVLYDPNKTLAP
jgi:uncharacterized RDD family membrane protein YckC